MSTAFGEWMVAYIKGCITFPDPPTVTISATIENSYELYLDVTTYVVDLVLPVPPADETSDEYAEWEQEHIFPLTGAGHTDGDSWYDVTITASSDPELVGRDFVFGY